MYPIKLTPKERIIEFLTANQESIKKDVAELRQEYSYLLQNNRMEFRQDMEDQYEARIRQIISFTTAEATGLAIEYVIIEIEKMDMEGYLEI